MSLPDLYAGDAVLALHFVGEDSRGEAQHSGLGTRLIKRAKELAREAGYEKLAVISAIGTRSYYARQGFVPDRLYMSCSLRAG